MSMSLAELLDHEVIEVAGKSPGGTTTYKANPDITHTILTVLRKRERRMLSRVSSSAKLLPSLQNNNNEVPLNHERIQALQNMVSMAEQTLDCLLSLKDCNFEMWQQFTDCDK